MRRLPLAPLRRELLAVPGLGPETADAILLYGAERPVFVADAYARRVLVRHRLLRRPAGYEQARAFLEAHLPSDPALFNEYHALLVAIGKTHCRTVPPCARSPLRPRREHQPATHRHTSVSKLTRRASASGTASVMARAPMSFRRRGWARRAPIAARRRAGVSSTCGSTTAPPARSTRRAFSVCS